MYNDYFQRANFTIYVILSAGYTIHIEHSRRFSALKVDKLLDTIVCQNLIVFAGQNVLYMTISVALKTLSQGVAKVMRTGCHNNY